MTESSDEVIKVGCVQIGLEDAISWVRTYTDERRNKRDDRPYAFPAYDDYDGGGASPDVLSDGDLLAPVLLNVQVKLRSFYALQRIRSELEEALSHRLLSRPLEEIETQADVRSVVKPLYSVLDRHDPWGVEGTTLSKIVHRKRPRSLVLHDRWVRACYVEGEGAPVPRVPLRTWADYMVLVTDAIRIGLRSQQKQFQALDAATSRPGRLSHVRLLDILAWTSRGQIAQN